MVSRYGIQLDFDAQGEPPRVLIHDGEYSVVEVFEEPTCTHPSGWSWDDDDWEPGPMAEFICQKLAEHEERAATSPFAAWRRAAEAAKKND